MNNQAQQPQHSFHQSNSSRSLNQQNVSYPSSSTAPSFPTPPSGQDEYANLKNAMRETTMYFDTFQFPYIKDVHCYEKLNKIGQGTFGEVFKARCKTTGRMVALKKILMENEKEGFPITALREVKMLQQLRHPNVTDLIEVCSSRGGSSKHSTLFYLVFAFCEHDLAGLLSNQKIKLQVVHIKTMMKHLLNGLCKLHRAKILHRDMKAANVLISKEGVLKLADFGLARPFMLPMRNQPRQSYTNRVVTLWYRPPELLLGERQYDTKIDIWGAGCIMAEMWTRKPIMQGDTEQRQLTLISGLCGSICKEVWPKCEQMQLWKPLAEFMPQGKPRQLYNKIAPLIKDDDAMKLLDRLLAIDPEKRPCSEDSVDDAWFFKKPEAKDNVHDLMLTIPTSQFEFTVGKGAHANRGRHHQGQQQRTSTSARPSNVPAGQLCDVIF